MNTYKTEEVIMTRFNIGATLLVIAAILLVSNCSKDSDGKGSTAPKADILIYGLLGSRPHWVDPDSSLFWAYARVFDHPDHQNVEAELVHDTTVISLEANYHDSEKFFSEGQSFFSFEPDEEYTFRAWDLNRSYSGTITTLPQIRIINNTVISNQITLQWTDVGADFYDVGFLDWGNFEKHYQVKDTLFAIDIDSLPFYSGIIDIDIGGFKGFNPMSHPGGNIQGCYGYLFGYTMDETVLDMTTMTFSKPSFHEIPPDLDDLMLFFFDNKVTTQRDYSYEDPEFMFTYARIDNWGYSSSSFSSITIVEPANSISSIEGYLNGIQLDGYIWAGFYSVFRTWDDLYLTYDKDMLFTYTLALNNMLDSATVANPDTFSMLTHPPEDTIPEVPFEIRWNRPENADFFLVYVFWEVKDDSLNRNFLYVTENTFYLVTQIPDSVVWGGIGIVAIAGANPLKEMEPNLKRLNGYFYSLRWSENYVSFHSNGLQNCKSKEGFSVRSFDSRSIEKVDEFMLGRLREKHPEMNVYRFQ